MVISGSFVSSIWKSLFALAVIGLLLAGCDNSKHQQPSPFLEKFLLAKQTQTQQIVSNQNLSMPRKGWQLFEALRQGDWNKSTNLFARLDAERNTLPTPPNPFTQIVDWGEAQLAKSGIYEPKTDALISEAWQPMVEAYWACSILQESPNDPSVELAREIIKTVPKGSLYFGGTDGGRFVVSALIDSQVDGIPFFVLTQNQLVDGGYRDYLVTTFGSQLTIPDWSQYNRIYFDHLPTIQKRIADGELSTNQAVRVQVLELNIKFMQAIVEKNSGREAFLELSHRLAPVYSKLKPVGPIFQFCRESVGKFPPENLQAHASYWSEFCRARLGVTFDTLSSVTQACDFVELRLVKRDDRGFSGDKAFLQSKLAQAWASDMRYWAADWHWWYFSHPEYEQKNLAGFQQLLLAHAQAFALSPRNHRAVEQLVQLLESQARYEEAKRVLKLALALTPGDPDLVSKLRELESRRQ